MKKVRFGVIGAGGIARRRAIPGILESRHCELVAVMNPHGAQEIAREFSVAAAYETEEALLQDPKVDAVYIASPVGVHREQILKAAKCGKHILCEKPLTKTIAEARAAVRACQKNGVFLQEGYMMKFHGAHEQIDQLIREGKIGKVVSMRAQLSCWYPPMKGAWRQIRSEGGGGALIDMASHLFDLLESFAGPVQGISTRIARQIHDYEVEDSAVSLLEFKSGALATVDSFFCIPDEAVPTRLEIYGSEGAILAEGTIGQGSGGTLRGIFNQGKKGYDAGQKKEAARGYQSLEFPQVNPYTAEFDYFAQCILKKKAPVINGIDNALNITKLVEAAYQSARSGKQVRVRR